MIRAPKPTDQGYVTKNWVVSLARHRHEKPDISRYVDRVLGRPETRILIACPTVAPDYIRGWICYAEGVPVPTVHYLYVRPELRRGGLATALLAHIGVERDSVLVFTADSRDGRKMVTAYPGGALLPLPKFLTPPNTKGKL